MNIAFIGHGKVGGALADRRSPRTIMLVSDALRFLLAGALAETVGALTACPPAIPARLPRSIDEGSNRKALRLRGSRRSGAGDSATSSCSPVKKVSLRRPSSKGAGALIWSQETGPPVARTV